MKSFSNGLQHLIYVSPSYVHFTYCYILIKSMLSFNLWFLFTKKKNSQVICQKKIDTWKILLILTIISELINQNSVSPVLPILFKSWFHINSNVKEQCSQVISNCWTCSRPTILQDGKTQSYSSHHHCLS